MVKLMTDYKIGLKTQGKKHHSVMIQHDVYQELKTITIQTEQPIYELVDKALTHYLANPPAIEATKNRWLTKRISVYDNIYRLLQQESLRTGKSIQDIATNAFIQYLKNINGEINMVDMV
jgi:predicted CopG family antitoxin